jgi:uncharacterized protein
MKKIIFLSLLLSQTWAYAQRTAVPQLWGHAVHDEAHILSTATIDHLEGLLKAHEDSTSNQIAVLIIPSLEGEVLEEYSLRVAHDEWKLGQKKNDNGVLLLIVVDDHKVRIEVGYGLEGVLTDAITSRIIRNEIAPHFRESEYDAGVTAAVEAIIKSIGGEYTADETAAEMTWKERLFIGLFIFSILGVFTFIGLMIPGREGWFLYAFLIPFYATFPMVVFGFFGGLGALATYVVGFPVLKSLLPKTNWGKRVSTKMSSGRSSGGGWSSGSGWSSRGGSSSGGFSGGGGGFGGGGSSGSW